MGAEKISIGFPDVSGFKTISFAAGNTEEVAKELALFAKMHQLTEKKWHIALTSKKAWIGNIIQEKDDFHENFLDSIKMQYSEWVRCESSNWVLSFEELRLKNSSFKRIQYVLIQKSVLQANDHIFKKI